MRTLFDELKEKNLLCECCQGHAQSTDILLTIPEETAKRLGYSHSIKVCPGCWVGLGLDDRVTLAYGFMDGEDFVAYS